MGETLPERSGWRDEKISRQHRLWGVECQITDIDFLVLEYYKEYDVIRPTALVEYKNIRAKRQNSNYPQYVALAKLGSAANIPFFVVIYSDDFQKMIVQPMNAWAKVTVPRETCMSERQYVTFLYRLRGYDEVPQKVLNTLQGDLFYE